MVAHRFKLDESLPHDAVALLHRSRHDVQTVHDEGLSGALDPAVVAAGRKENPVLVTLDVDFADIRAYPPAETPGVMVLRPGNQSIRAVLGLLEHAVQSVTTEPVAHRLWVVEPGRIRVRQ